MRLTRWLPNAPVLAWICAAACSGSAMTILGVEAAPLAGRTAPSSTPSLGEALQTSTAEQVELSEHLRRQGIIFYGAWWCPACFRQKSLFGKEAGNRLPYVECDKTSEGRNRCRAEGIKAYPTWVWGEKRLEGLQSIEDLKRWSRYPSP